jgi:hypothetical protein
MFLVVARIYILGSSDAVKMSLKHSLDGFEKLVNCDCHFCLSNQSHPVSPQHISIVHAVPCSWKGVYRFPYSLECFENDSRQLLVFIYIFFCQLFTVDVGQSTGKQQTSVAIENDQQVITQWKGGTENLHMLVHFSHICIQGRGFRKIQF